MLSMAIFKIKITRKFSVVIQRLVVFLGVTCANENAHTAVIHLELDLDPPCDEKPLSSL